MDEYVAEKALNQIADIISGTMKYRPTRGELSVLRVGLNDAESKVRALSADLEKMQEVNDQHNRTGYSMATYIEELKKDLEAVAVAAQDVYCAWDAEPTKAEMDALAEALARPGVVKALEAKKDG